jgi:hypothetical protein|tara:strand:+ start:93 stop:260 length:168 start_codon:yes stop_codon:yes gene_type:complete
MWVVAWWELATVGVNPLILASGSGKYLAPMIIMIALIASRSRERVRISLVQWSVI